MPREIGLFPPPYLWYLLKGFIKAPDKQQLPHHVFLSFEDALWAILAGAGLPVGSTFLYPSFFCLDVVDRLQERGLKGISYPLDKKLGVETAAFRELIKKHAPSLVFVYHPLGIRSPFMDDTDWLSDVPTSCILIEDCADMLLEDRQIRLIHDRHFIIDSLRKVTPFQGARLFYQGSVPIQTPQTFSLANFLLHAAVRTLNLVTSIIPARPLLLAKWYLFGVHSDNIGKSLIPLACPIIDKVLFHTLSITKFKSYRARHFQRLIEAVRSLQGFGTDFWIPALSEDTLLELRFLPLIFSKGRGKLFADSLERYGIYVDTHFEDAPFAKEYDCVLLPSNAHEALREIS